MPNRSVPAIPEPLANIPALYETVKAVKEVVETLAGQRNSRDDMAVTWRDLDKFNLGQGYPVYSGDGSSINLTLGVFSIDTSWPGQSSITTLGTVVTGTWTATTVGAAYGGTGHSAYTVGDILYASGAATLSKLAGVATGNALVSGGVGAAPSWGKIGLSTHVNGTLQAAQFPALTGDVTTVAGSLATAIANGAVTYAKMQDVSATSRFLGRVTAGAGDVEEIPPAQAKTILAITNADVSGLGTAAVQNTGASGANVPLLSVANTWSLAQTFSSPPVVPSYTVAAAPSAAAAGAGAIIYVTDESGGAVLAFSDGADWRRSTDRAVIS